MSTLFDIGDAPTLTWRLYSDQAKTIPADATVELSVKKPDGTSLTPDVDHVETGVYSAVVDIDQYGPWRYRWVATGALKAAEEGTIQVRKSLVL